MKKKLIGILTCFILIIGLTGCEEKKSEVTLNELKEIMETITTKIASDENYTNFSSCYIKEDQKIIIVELINNTKEEQDLFKQNIVNSEYIKFEKGEYLTTFISNIEVSKTNETDDKKWKEYYKNNERTIYLESNIEEVYVSNEKEKNTLKYYIKNTNQTLEKSLEAITSKLIKMYAFDDGGTTVYQSEEKDITVIVCNTLTGNKDIHIKTSVITSEDNLCKKES